MITIFCLTLSYAVQSALIAFLYYNFLCVVIIFLCVLVVWRKVCDRACNFAPYLMDCFYILFFFFLNGVLFFNHFSFHPLRVYFLFFTIVRYYDYYYYYGLFFSCFGTPLYGWVKQTLHCTTCLFFGNQLQQLVQCASAPLNLFFFVHRQMAWSFA